jgi:hypothetical protein
VAVYRVSIFRKSTTTDSIIPYDSCHPINNRQSSVSFISNRLYTYALLPRNKKIETQIISNIIFNNNCKLNILDQVNYKSNKHSKRNSMNEKDMNNNKWLSFTYVEQSS